MTHTRSRSFVVTDATLAALAKDPQDIPQAVRYWLQAILPSAAVTFDRSGYLRGAVAAAQAHQLMPADAVAVWYAVNAEAIVIRRLRASPTRERELVATLPAAFDLLWRAHFACRQLPEMSHKQRLIWLDAHAPTFWARWSAALEAPHPDRADAWLTLAAESLEPGGGLWPEGEVLEAGGDSRNADTTPPSLTQLLKGAK